jgi:hypothetical protein
MASVVPGALGSEGSWGNIIIAAFGLFFFFHELVSITRLVYLLVNFSLAIALQFILLANYLYLGHLVGLLNVLL